MPEYLDLQLKAFIYLLFNLNATPGINFAMLPIIFMALHYGVN